MDIKKELDSNQTILLLMPSIEYNDISLDIIKQLSGKNVCYVTLNKTGPSILENLNKKKVNTKNIVFVDAISKTIKSVPNQTKGCYFVSSPAALTGSLNPPIIADIKFNNKIGFIAMIRPSGRFAICTKILFMIMILRIFIA